MTGLLAIVDNDQLVGPVLIGVGMLAIATAALTWDRRIARADQRAADLADTIEFHHLDGLQLDEHRFTDPLQLPILAHTMCRHDGCTKVLCHCGNLHPVTGQPMSCVGAEGPACPHSGISRATDGGHCAQHVNECGECDLDVLSVYGAPR